MAIYKRFSPNIRSAFSIVLMIAVWLAFAPTQVGGWASYIIVIGNSMEPNFHIGDLVIVHKEPVYQVGDAIVYRNLELKSFVFHRIVSQQMGHYALKGDNNSWVDTYQPSQEEVLGKLWFYLPHGGTAFQKMRSPFAMALMAGTLGAVITTCLFLKKAKGNKHMNDRSLSEWFTWLKQKMWNRIPAERFALPASVKFDQGELLESSFFVLGLLALASFILGIIAFSRPISRTLENDISYEHLGIFSYSASTPQGIYDSNIIQGGDPIFTKLTCSVDINFQYTLVAGQAQNATGTYQLTAILSEPVSGWKRVIPLQEETSFTGTVFGTTAGLSLCQIEALTQSLEQGTDFHPASYSLVVVPNIKLDASVASRALKDTFNPTLDFRYDRVQFYLVRNEKQENPLTFIETGILPGEHQEPNTILLLGRALAISRLRLISLLGLIGSLGGLILLGIRLQNLSQHAQEKFFSIKYSSIMIDIQSADSMKLSGVVDVSTIDMLAKLAERFNAMILHVEQNQLHTYYVQTEALTYRFTISAEKKAASLLESGAVIQEGEA